MTCRAVLSANLAFPHAQTPLEGLPFLVLLLTRQDMPICLAKFLLQMPHRAPVFLIAILTGVRRLTPYPNLFVPNFQVVKKMKLISYSCTTSYFSFLKLSSLLRFTVFTAQILCLIVSVMYHYSTPVYRARFARFSTRQIDVSRRTISTSRSHTRSATLVHIAFGVLVSLCQLDGMHIGVPMEPIRASAPRQR